MAELTPEQELELLKLEGLGRAQAKRKGISPEMRRVMKELSGALPDKPLYDRAAEFEALPTWKKPLVAADDMATILADTITFGYGAKGAAKVNELTGGGTYEDELASIRSRIADSEERAGWAGVGMKGVGLTLPSAAGLTLMRPAVQGMKGATGLGARMGLMGLEGAALGGLNAAGHDQDISGGATTGAIFGAGGQGVGEALGKVAGRVFSNRNAAKNIPLDDLAKQKKAAYEAADNLGVEYTPQALRTLRRGIGDDMSTNLMDPITAPNTSALVSALSKRLKGGPKKLSEVEHFRKMAGKKIYGGNSSKEDARLGQMVIDNIDEFVEAAGPGQVLSGDPAAASEILKAARGLHVKTSKIEKLNQALRNAELRAGSTGAGGNVENATRQELAKLLKNNRTARQFKSETKQIEEVVKGTKTQNALRHIGKLAPSGIVSSSLSSMLGAGLGGTVGGGPGAMIGSVALPAVGGVAKKLADKGTRKGVEELVRLISTGKPKPSGDVLSKPIREMLARALLGGGIAVTSEP